LEYIKEVTLDLDLRKELPIISVKQGDASTRSIIAHLKKDGEAFIPDDDIYILFRCEKPDGHGVILSSIDKDEELDRFLVIDRGNGDIFVELVAQVSTACGCCRCDICLCKDEKILSTIPFMIDVKRSPNATNLAVSSDDFRVFSARIKQAEGLMRGVSQSVATLTLSNDWSGASSPYRQTVYVIGYDVNKYTKVDLVGDPAVIEAMLGSRTDEIMVINEEGTLVAYAIGGRPDQVLTVQACVYDTLKI